MRIDEIAASFHELDSDRPAQFEELAEAAFRYQVANNEVYRRFVGEMPAWSGWRSAPPLPVEAFKLGSITTGNADDAEASFLSSGTSGSTPATHHVRRLGVYDRSALTHFRRVFGEGPQIIIANLPGYAQRGAHSSLVYMVRRLIEEVGSKGSGFFLDDSRPLEKAVGIAQRTGGRIILFGAAFGLLDLADNGGFPLPHGSIVIETGGMKTHRRSVERTELHSRLSSAFAVPRSSIYSEYGMCELLSQCYTRGGAAFFPPPWMRFDVVDTDDPARRVEDGERGLLRVFDLANIFSVSAILTQDLAVRCGEGFEVLGRRSSSELRGCNFLLDRA